MGFHFRLERIQYPERGMVEVLVMVKDGAQQLKVASLIFSSLGRLECSKPI